MVGVSHRCQLGLVRVGQGPIVPAVWYKKNQKKSQGSQQTTSWNWLYMRGLSPFLQFSPFSSTRYNPGSVSAAYTTPFESLGQ